MNIKKVFLIGLFISFHSTHTGIFEDTVISTTTTAYKEYLQTFRKDASQEILDEIMNDLLKGAPILSQAIKLVPSDMVATIESNPAILESIIQTLMPSINQETKETLPRKKVLKLIREKQTTSTEKNRRCVIL